MMSDSLFNVEYGGFHPMMEELMTSLMITRSGEGR